MIILGLNAYHGDSAACLLRDGEIVAAAEEERFRRIKHWAGFPSRGDPLLPRARRAPRSPTSSIVAVNSDPGASFLKKVGYALRQPARHRPHPRPGAQPGQAAVDRGRARRGVSRRRPSRARSIASSTTSRISPPRSWSRRSARRRVVSVDGFGDFSSAAWGVGPRHGDRRRGPGLFPALARRLLPGAHPVSGLSALRRRVQGDGPRALRQARVPGRDAPDRAPAARAAASSSTPLTSATTARRSTTPGGRQPARRHAVLAGARGAARARARERTSRSATPPRHRALGAGHVRGGVLPPPRAPARAAPARQPDAGRRLRHELGRQRQGAAPDALQAALCAVGGGRCGRRDRRGDHVWHQTWRRANAPERTRAAPSALAGDALRGRTVMEHAYLGPAAQRRGDRGPARRHAAASSDSSGCRVERIDDEDELCRRTAEAIARRRAWSAGSRAAWSGVRARSATARSSAIRAAPT